MLGLGLAEVSPEGEGVGDGDAFPGRQAGSYLGQALVLPANGHLARLKTFSRADEYDGIALEGLQSCFRHRYSCWCYIRRDLGGDERARPPFKCSVVDRGGHAGGARVLIE